MKTFYLGTHMPNWLPQMGDIPLFISYSRLRGRKTLPKAAGRYAIDSSGFMQLSMNGEWTISPERYVTDVIRYRDEIGPMDWAAPQDWMCEPWIIAKTSLSVREHQARTIKNFVHLCRLWREQSDDPCPFIPVLQGWDLTDYRTCLRMYGDAAIDLHSFPVVGLGSVCRRQATDEIGEVVEEVLEDAPGLRLHGFGVKAAGIVRYGFFLESADSMSWSFRARRSKPLPGCRHKSCANCPKFARVWYGRVHAKALAAEPRPRQLDIFHALGGAA